MDTDINLLDLPDLVLHNICTFITNPFDLLHLGNTCSQLRRISSVPSLWWPVVFHWFDGVWIYMNLNSNQDHPREWLLEVFRKLTILPTGTETKCIFSNGEKWERVESRKFRCIFGMLRLVYARKRDYHPAVLYEQWLYDIGLYRRDNAHTDFTLENLEFSPDAILKLSHLSQAVERDLQRRKQPNKDPKYYIKRIATSGSDWMSELFPIGMHGTICPMLMCPFQNSYTNEMSGLQGISVCLSMVLAKYLKRRYKSSLLPLKDICTLIRTFCSFFVHEAMNVLPQMRSQEGENSLKRIVLTLINENSLTHILQDVLNVYKLNFSAKDVLAEFAHSLHQFDGIDWIVDKVRSRLRNTLFDEINCVLFQNNVSNCTVTRINLTDSDLIGGDNNRQEMSSAAFISQKGVLVSWHLIGRMRF